MGGGGYKGSTPSGRTREEQIYSTSIRGKKSRCEGKGKERSKNMNQNKSTRVGVWYTYLVELVALPFKWMEVSFWVEVQAVGGSDRGTPG